MIFYLINHGEKFANKVSTLEFLIEVQDVMILQVGKILKIDKLAGCDKAG